ncbi:MAG: iron-sulfur cluster assembly accessory protein [Thermaerobacter sp.]|nr:iron-sulfur cluster assembly accessory protein [Thermaerobacter sp.]
MVQISTAAAQKVQELMAQEGGSQSLRLFVSGGGCAGYSYGMAFDNEERDGDEVAEVAGVRLIVDENSAPLLRGAEIDYVDSIQGSGFTIHNPNAVKSCSCGHSFSTEEGSVHSHC